MVRDLKLRGMIHQQDSFVNWPMTKEERQLMGLGEREYLVVD